jgi:hypothetical protein
MIATTCKLDATETQPDRIRVTTEDGATGTFCYPYRHGLDGRDAHAWAVRQLFAGPEFGEPVWLDEHARGERYRVPEGDALAYRDKVTMSDVTVPIEDRRAATRRHNQRQGAGA